MPSCVSFAAAPLLLLLLLLAATATPQAPPPPPTTATTTTTTATLSNHSQVPLLLSNQRGAPAGATPTQPVKVPSRRNVSADQWQPSSANVLVFNIKALLWKIRSDEMRVTAIQEIFDSLSMPNGQNPLRNLTDPIAPGNPSAALQKDLRVFGKRLGKKLQKATHVVLELRDFFRFNVTSLLRQEHRTRAVEYVDEEDETASDFEAEIDDVDDVRASAPSETEVWQLHYYLNTYIETCQQDAPSPSTEYDAEAGAEAEFHYNREQIQIVNYLRTEHDNSLASAIEQEATADFLEDSNERSLEANTFITAKIQRLKEALHKNDVYDVDTTARNLWRHPSDTPAKRKFLGNHLKHIFFLSSSDDASDDNDDYFFDLNFRRLYVAAIRFKYVFLVIDVGSAMNADLLELTKTFVGNVLQVLSDTDYISIVTVSDEAKVMALDVATTEAIEGFYPATRERKEEVLHFLSNLGVAKTLTNHSLGFEYAFQMLQALQNASLITAQNPVQLVYVTRGLLTNLSDATQVLHVISEGQRKLQQPIRIHTCGVVLDVKRIMYEKQFLQDISSQNYTKFEIKVDDWLKKDSKDSSISGRFFLFTKAYPDTMMRASTAIFEQSFTEDYVSHSLEVYAPVMEGSTKDALVAITHAVPPFGVVGVNLYLSDLIEDVVYFRQESSNTNEKDSTYAFLVDRSGVTIAHPAFPRPITQSQTPYPVDIGFLENSTDFSTIRHRILAEDSGNATTTVYLKTYRKTEMMDRTYAWQSVLGIYILCLVANTKRDSTPGPHAPVMADNVVRSSLNLPTSPPPSATYANKDAMTHYPRPLEYQNYLPASDLLYHRLDLLPPQNAKVCRYFRQVATMDAATLFLSASAFESPFTFLHNNRMSSQKTQERTKGIVAYLKDITNLMANPGLRPQIRYEVNALDNAMQQLRKRHQDSRGPLKNHIIRRYIATVNGVLQVYPGCLLSGNYDPTRRPWFRKALMQPGKIATTEPYLDAGGAGYIVTIAHTIFEGKSNALHTKHDQPVAIVAVDLPYAFYYRQVLESTPLCQMNNIKCLLFENEGFLIAHPSMLEPSTPLRNQRRPHEHLTHKESYLANDILNHKKLVRKLACANYQNRTLQRYYVFNTSLTEILTNVVHGERTKYAIGLIPDSNIFAAVLNSTCDGGAFCPCSTIDRICLNCNRMDQTDCECPCECPMEVDDVGALSDAGEQLQLLNYTRHYAYCEPPSEDFVALPPTSRDQGILPSCVSINCDVFGTQSECLAIMGCEWCQQDVDGNGFTAAFCTTQSSCFNGVLASLTPYGDLDDADMIAAHGFNPSQKANSYSALGPVGGAIVVLAIVIGFAIYCYRHNVDAHAHEQFYVDSMQEENYGLPLSRFNFDDCQAHDDPPMGGNGYDHPAAQRNLMHPADISPYHVSTGSSYRRPPNGESDHGYSTMTPHEDSSDHQCFTLAEPLLMNDKRNSKSDTVSICTSISSPTNRHHHHSAQSYPHLGQGGKEGRHCVTSPKKSSYHHSPGRVYGETTLPLNDCHEEPLASPHYILAPVTVHRHMETSES